MMEIATGQEALNTMTQDVFNQLARSVNKDFVHLGFPTILTKKSGRDFVSLCALMNNCSALLASVKARSDQVTAAEVAAIDSLAKFTGKAASQQKRCRGSSIFSSKSSLKHSSQQSTSASVFEGIAEKVKRDTEDVIESTRCLPEPGELTSLVAGGDEQQTRQTHPDKQLMFFATRWVQFKETITRKLLEAGQLAVEVQSLRSALGRGLPRSKSVSGEPAGIASGAPDLDIRPRQRSLSRTEGHVSVTKIPSLEAEIRRLKLEMNRREQRHKDELDRQAKERERMARDFRLAQRRIQGPRWPISTTAPAVADGQPSLQLHHSSNQQPLPLLPQQPLPQLLPPLPQQQQSNSEPCDHIVSDVCHTLERLANCLGSQHQPQLRPESESGGSRKHSHQQQQHQVRAYVDGVCNAALSRIQGLQADCSTSRRRQADLEVLVSILKARLDLTNDQIADVAKFEAAVNDIAQRLTASTEVSGLQQQQSLQDSPAAPLVAGDENRVDSLVSRLTSRLRERQRPQ